MTPEATLKRKLRSAIHNEGWIYIAPIWGVRGWPDAMILIPGGITIFIEVKAPGAKHSARHLARQCKVHEELRSKMFPVFIISDSSGIDRVIKAIKETIRA